MEIHFLYNWALLPKNDMVFGKLNVYQQNFQDYALYDLLVRVTNNPLGMRICRGV